MEEFLKNKGFGDDIITILKENDVDMEVLPTLTQEDLQEIGVKSFGVRRKLRLVIEKIQPQFLAVDDLSACSTSHLNRSILSSVSSESDSTADDEAAACAPPKIVTMSKDTLKFNIKEDLNNRPEGKAVALHLERGGILSNQQRRTLIQIAVASLIAKCGLYPTSIHKTTLAKTIVETYPSTKDNTPGMEGYEHFYANGHGFIEYRLKNIRMARPQEERSRKRTPSKRKLHNQMPDELIENVSATEEDTEKVNWMNFSPPTHDNQTKHRQYFRETHKYRRSMIGKGMTITDVMKIYPRFQDMPELMSLEFEMMFPEQCDSFIRKWNPHFRDRILYLGKQDYSAVQDQIEGFKDGDMDLCALNVLVFMLHRNVYRKKGKKTSTSSRADSVRYLVQNAPEGTDVEAYVEGKEDRYNQPFLLALGPPKAPTQYFMVLDKIAVPAGLSTVEAFDQLFKCHYVFNVEYSSALHQFWQFIACNVYGVLKPTEITPSVRAFGASVSAVVL